MAAYARPLVEPLVFRDAAGRVVRYGARWGDGPPPDDSYSVTSNLARFAPLHTIADALVDHLRSAYDVAVEEGPEVARDLIRPPDEIVRAVRLTPADPGAAALTFVFTSFPSVVIHAGLLHDLPFPTCGCDACDETWDALADEMEWQVLAVASGGYREAVSRDAGLGVEYSLRGGDGSARRSGRSRVEDHENARLQAAERALRGLPEGWRPWPALAG
ncbi:DUF6226 family protein [Naasia sp. SYSU D00948]|uniref:DUF6226 family protein n=1 Tax=Naasia sp. SYSU D00948 TaxID=2817379 RepID=UPI001B308BF9|nr:DUF6226 family protein [Naasia sp. SYSU D00948]